VTAVDPERRARAIDRVGAQRLIRAASAKAASWRSAVGAEAPGHPEPFLAERYGRSPGRWEPTTVGVGEVAFRCGVDEAGTLVVASWRDGYDDVHEVFATEEVVRVTYPEGDDAGSEPIVHVTLFERDEAGRVTVARGNGGYLVRFHRDRTGSVERIEQQSAEDGPIERATYRVLRSPGGTALALLKDDEVVWRAAEPLAPEQEPAREKTMPAIRPSVEPGAARRPVRSAEKQAEPVPEPDSAFVPPRTREELRQTLERLGLGRVAENVCVAARAGFELRICEPARGRSHLGGTPPLDDAAWPRSGDRRMTPLAAIDRSELLGASARALGPAHGRLLFFADLAGLRRQDPRLLARPGAVVESTRAQHDRDRAALRHERDAFELLPHTDVKPIPVLTIPPTIAVADELAMNHDERRRYDRVATALARDRTRSPAQLLGHPFDDRDDDALHDALLFEINDCDRVGFNLHDDGALRFVLDAQDLTARRWEAVRIVVTSG
jgi:hypothetical protein